MAKDDKLIIEYRRRNAGYAVPPPAGSWELLEKELLPVRHPRLLSYKWLAIAGFFLLLIALSVYYYPVSRCVESPVLTELQKLDIQVVNGNVEPRCQVKNSSILPSVKTTLFPERNMGERRPARERPGLLEPAVFWGIDSDKLSVFYDLKPIRSRPAVFSPAILSSHPEILLAEPPGKRPETGWSVGFFGENTLTNSISGTAGMGMFNFPKVSADAGIPAGKYNINNTPGTGTLEDFRNSLLSNTVNFHSRKDYKAFEEVAVRNYNVPTETKVKHKFPVSAGISVRKAFLNNFSLETGLVYTLLASELVAGESSFYKQEQTLQYLGVPVKMGYTFWKQQRFSLYASAGGMVEMCVKGSLSTDYYVDKVRVHQSKEAVDVGKAQFSVLAALGAQFDVVKSLSLFAEPGIQYFFDDKSEVETVRKEHPLNASVLLGVRISF